MSEGIKSLCWGIGLFALLGVTSTIGSILNGHLSVPSLSVAVVSSVALGVTLVKSKL